MASQGKLNVWNRALYRTGWSEKIETESDDCLSAELCRDLWDDVVHQALEAARWPFARKQAPLTSIASESVVFVFDAAVSATEFEITFAFTSSSQVSVTKNGVALVLTTDYSVTYADPVTATSAKITLVAPLIALDTITITVTHERYGWEYIYTLPADCVTPLALVTEDGARYGATAVDLRPEWEIQADDGGTRRVLVTDLEQGEDFDALEYTALVDHVPLWPRDFLNAVIWLLAAELAMPLTKVQAQAEHCRQRYGVAADLARARYLNEGRVAPPQTPSLAARG